MYQIMIDYHPVGKPISKGDRRAWIQVLQASFPNSTITWKVTY